MSEVLAVARSFVQEEEGASLAEYLVLLGVLVLAVAGGITFFGQAINDAFQSWGSWIRDNAGSPPALG